MRLSIASLLVALAAVPLSAQEIPEWLAKLSIHGYISQAYAVSSDYQILGIPTDGTTDYRGLALQFRYDLDRDNVFALQLQQERRGKSRRENDDVELDWGFFQHNFSDRLAVKVGRIPLPLGIYNEAAGAATTYPFFRPPHEFYDRQLTSKTLDGLLTSASIGESAWTFDVDGYFGQWALDDWESGEPVDARDAWGLQTWVNTPWPAVRFGGGAYRCTVEPGDGDTAEYVMLHGSAEVNLDRWQLASEYLSGDLAEYGRYRSWYSQIGYEVTRRFSVHLRGAISRATVPVNDHMVRATLSEDLAVALNFQLRPSLLLKVEGHTNEGFLREDVPVNLYADPASTRYFIASVAASF